MILVKGWKLEREDGIYKQWSNEKYPAFTVSIGQFKKAEPWENNPKWSGKFYVEIDDYGSGKNKHKEILFNSYASAESYASSYMNKMRHKHL